MNCCQCQGIEEQFNEQTVSRELAEYRIHGPRKTTRMLVDALKANGIQGFSLLDIGGGVGAIQHELLNAGAQNATGVDASRAYLAAAKSEAERRGLTDRISFHHGNFVDIAGQILPADIVTLDRVICCYPHVEELVSLSLARARKLYGLVYPRDVWWVKTGIRMLNFFFGLRKTKYRTFVHPTQAVETIINQYGFKRLYYNQTLIWQVVVYST
jgi:2-polyprenyl-3-methyl-5-hydroxy-6-metoxy-1,4-benzoquinol methylase